MRYLHAEGKVVLSDYREYMKFHIFRCRFSRIIRILADLLLFFLLTWLLLSGIRGGSTGLVVLAGAGFLCYFMFQYLLRRHVKNTCLKNKPFLYATHEVDFGNNGVLYTVRYDGEHNPRHLEDSETRYLYDELVHIYETSGFFYLYPTGRSAVIVPKRNMTFRDEAKLRELLRSRVGKRYARCL